MKARPNATATTFVTEAAIAWVEELSSKLLEHGRPIEGGWPGTVSEAKRRVRAFANSAELTSVARGELARALYQDARARWLSISRPPAPLLPGP